MNIIFFGTSGFAVPSLKALAGSSHKVILVVTQPDRKKGRHLALKPPVLKEVATSLELPVFQPVDASGSGSINELKNAHADLFVVVSFGQILSEEVLALPKKFAINLHASLLPEYRGAAPVNWAIINGDKKTGVSVFKLEKKMDAGGIILDKEQAIANGDDAVTLSKKLADAGAGVLIDSLDLIEKGQAVFKKQDEALVTFAPKLKKSDGLINWGITALEIHNRVRGLLPWPGAFTKFECKIIKILETKVASCDDDKGALGQIVGIKEGVGIIVKTAKGCIAIQRLQPEGSRPMGFDEYLRGHKLVTGDTIG